MKILNYKKTYSGKAIATFDVNLDKIGITLRGFKLIPKKDGSGNFIAFPSFSEDTADQNKKWIPYFELEKSADFISALWKELKLVIEDSNSESKASNTRPEVFGSSQHLPF